MNYDSILFDLDGTLWDSTMGVQKTWAILLPELPESLAIPSQQELAGIMGLNPEDVMRQLYPQLTRERGLEIFRHFSKAEASYLSKHGATLYPALHDMLKTLASQYPLFIISNCESGYIESFLHAHDTEPYFTDWACVGDTGQNKSQNIRLIIERHNLKKPVYVGDTSWDYDAATAADVPFIHATYGFGKISQSVPVINTPMELISLLDQNNK